MFVKLVSINIGFVDQSHKSLGRKVEAPSREQESMHRKWYVKLHLMLLLEHTLFQDVA